jgi:hypothetical protein
MSRPNDNLRVGLGAPDRHVRAPTPEQTAYSLLDLVPHYWALADILPWSFGQAADFPRHTPASPAIFPEAHGFPARQGYGADRSPWWPLSPVGTMPRMPLV